MKDEDIKRLNFNGWPLPDDYLIEIGRVSAVWASLESLLNLCLGKLAGFEVNDPKPFIFVNHASFPQRLDMLGSLCEQLAPDHLHLANYNAVLGMLRTAQKLRNTYMHNGMNRNPETGHFEMPIANARGSLSFKVQKVTLQDIRRATVAISEANRALYKLVLKVDIPLPWESRQTRDGR